MKKIILTAAIMLASVGAYAQFAVGSINLQPKVGLNISNITDIDGTDPPTHWPCSWFRGRISGF